MGYGTEFYSAVGFNLDIRLSLHDPKEPKKYLGTPEMWEKAEGKLREVIKEKGVNAVEVVGEAAFYAPKIDFMSTDSLGREWQMATIQLDINLPERFDLTCVNEKGENERIAMVHAAIMGSIERYLSILIEHFDGAFPLWLSPIQIKVLPIGEKHRVYARKAMEKLLTANIRAELDDSDETLGKKIRNAKLEKVPYMLVIGDEEVEKENVTLESRSEGKVGQLPLEKVIERLTKEIEERAI